MSRAKLCPGSSFDHASNVSLVARPLILSHRIVCIATFPHDTRNSTTFANAKDFRIRPDKLDDWLSGIVALLTTTEAFWCVHRREVNTRQKAVTRCILWTTAGVASHGVLACRTGLKVAAWYQHRARLFVCFHIEAAFVDIVNDNTTCNTDVGWRRPRRRHSVVDVKLPNLGQATPCQCLTVCKLERSLVFFRIFVVN